MPILRVIEGPLAGASAEVGDQPVSIGRELGNVLRIEDPKSSRFHAEVLRIGNGWVLKDLGSSNGTWCEAGRVGDMPLSDGSVFRIGRTYIRFEDVEAAAQARTAGADPQTWADPALLRSLKDWRGGTESFAQGGGADEAAKQNSYLALLQQIIEKTGRATGRDQLFEVLDDAACEVLEGDRVAVFLPDPQAEDGWSLWPAHAKRLKARHGAVPFARTLLRTVRQQREPLLVTSQGDLDPTASMLRAGVRTAMAAPLRIGDTVHALLYVDRIKGVSPFTRNELEFLAAVANQLAATLANREQVVELEAELDRLRSAPQSRPIVLVGRSLEPVLALGARLASSPSPVLIRGEHGTGKELMVRLLHQGSTRADRPLHIFSCAGLAETQALAGLFGTAAGDHPGACELADGASLLLDEIGDLPAAAQARLISVLERQECLREGGAAPRRADLRLFATSTRDLEAEAAAGRFRPDLLHRFAGFTIELPPLRERPGDLDALCDHLLATLATRLDQPPRRLAPETRALLMRASWPGNVQQLRQVLERACIAGSDVVIRPGDLPPLPGTGPAPTASPEVWPVMTMSELERIHILKVLDHCGGNKKAASEVLGIDRSTLYAKLRQYGVK